MAKLQTTGSEFANLGLRLARRQQQHHLEFGGLRIGRGLFISRLACFSLLMAFVLPPAAATAASAQAEDFQSGPFEGVLQLRNDIEQGFPQLLRVMEDQTAAKLCGYYNLETRTALLAEKKKAVVTEAADFGSQKVVRYVAMLEIETQIRRLAPLELKSWCQQKESDFVSGEGQD